jgi:hypothetical protein
MTLSANVRRLEGRIGENINCEREGQASANRREAVRKCDATGGARRDQHGRAVTCVRSSGRLRYTLFADGG